MDWPPRTRQNNATNCHYRVHSHSSVHVVERVDSWGSASNFLLSPRTGWYEDEDFRDEWNIDLDHTECRCHQEYHSATEYIDAGTIVICNLNLNPISTIAILYTVHRTIYLHAWHTSNRNVSAQHATNIPAQASNACIVFSYLFLHMWDTSHPLFSSDWSCYAVHLIISIF